MPAKKRSTSKRPGVGGSKTDRKATASKKRLTVNIVSTPKKRKESESPPTDGLGSFPEEHMTGAKKPSDMITDLSTFVPPVMISLDEVVFYKVFALLVQRGALDDIGRAYDLYRGKVAKNPTIAAPENPTRDDQVSQLWYCWARLSPDFIASMHSSALKKIMTDLTDVTGLVRGEVDPPEDSSSSSSSDEEDEDGRDEDKEAKNPKIKAKAKGKKKRQG